MPAVNTEPTLFEKVCDEVASEHYSKFYCELTDAQKVGLTEAIAKEFSIAEKIELMREVMKFETETK
jgi:hypothetical protein